MRLAIAGPTHAGRQHRGAVLAAGAAVGLAALLGGCSSSSSSDDTTVAPAASSSAASTADASMVDVIDQTNLLLVSAQQTLEARGLVVTVTDVTGQGRAVDDPTAWVVVSQAPVSGQVAAGSTVALEVRMKTDPIS